MEQHQVPQHIASYEFHLIGDMTLKQFFQVAAGGLVALAFYASPLPGIVKWPGVLFFGILGVALAFLPLEERPLSVWILLFLKSIYSPTLYKRGAGAGVEIFAPETQETNVAQVAAIPREEARVEPGAGAIISTLEEREESYLQKILSIFHQVQVTPAPQTEVRPSFVVEETIEQKQAPEVSIPLTQAPSFVPPAFQAQAYTPPPSTPIPSIPTPAPASPQSRTQTLAASFAPSAAPPFSPQTPNTAVGQVVDEEGNGVEAAILEIRDVEGRPARALRTNKVGHFLTATPLSPGTYQVIVEKDGYQFSPIQFAAMNNIIPPMEIKGKRTVNEN